MNDRRSIGQPFPRLPLLGWSAYSGEQSASTPSILSARHCRYTISGRAAIVLALRVLGIKKGDKVLVPTYHCRTMITPVVQIGALPVFYPVTRSGGPDLTWLEAVAPKSVRAMIAAHYFGIPQPMASLRRFCVARDISLVEDCAHAFFGISDNLPVGSWGDVSIASLTKFFPVTEGGLIASNTYPLSKLQLSKRGLHGEFKAVVDTIELAVEHGRLPGLNCALGSVFSLKRWLRSGRRRENQADTGPHEDTPEHLLSSSRPALVARWVSRSVHQERIVALRRRNYLALADALWQLPGANVLWPHLPDSVAPYVFPLYVDRPDESYQLLRSQGIPIFRWDDTWPDTPVIAGDRGLDWATHVFQLGCHQDLSSQDIRSIANIVRKTISHGA